MNASPKGQGKPRRVQIDLAAEAQDCEPDYQLPDVGAAEYFTSLLAEVGEAHLNGERIASLSWGELRAWEAVSGAEISPGVAESLRYLSSCYVSQYYQSIEPGCPAPHLEQPRNRDEVASKMKSLFAMLRK